MGNPAFGHGYRVRSSVSLTNIAVIIQPGSRMYRVCKLIAKVLQKKNKQEEGWCGAAERIPGQLSGCGNVLQRVNLLFNRRTYFTATINF